MEEWRSRAYGDDRRGGGGGRGVGRGQRASHPPARSRVLLSYDAAYAYSQQASQQPREITPKKGKSIAASTFSSSSAPKSSSSFKDPELQRKKRVGRMEGSFRKSFRWLKDRYNQVVNGWW